MAIKTTTDTARRIAQYISRAGAVRQVTENYEDITADVSDRIPSDMISPESEGMESEYILKFYREIENKKTLNMQTVTIARNGKIISCGEFYPYKENILAETHSFSKSVISLAVGMLVDDGKLRVDTTLGEIFADDIKGLQMITTAKLKIHHLLTMSTGVSFNELGSVTENDWVKAYLSSVVKFRAGTVFEYNSMNTYMLAATVVKLSGKSVCEFLDERLFAPLGIKEYYWEKCPKGIEKGGWGLHILPRDAVKLGQLIIDQGVYNGERIISEKWIREATRVQIKTPPITGSYDYGYQMWISEDDDEVLFNGIFGRNLHIFRKTHMVIFTTAMNGDIFQRCDLYPIIKKYFGKRFVPAATLPEDPGALKSLREYEKMLSHPHSLYRRIYDDSYRSDGEPYFTERKNFSFSFDTKTTCGISILPTVSQAIHNNFRKGIRKIAFTFNDDSVEISVTESDCKYDFTAGCGYAAESVVKIGCREYRIASMCELTQTEDDVPVMKLSVSFLQLSDGRYIKFYFDEDGLTAQFDELPGALFAQSGLDMIIRDSVNPSLVESARHTVNSRLFKSRLINFLNPTVKSK
ncbi:MAG: serine hydrolase [Clostridia bacterium]|nr:serine hydrolase [Clostridia bacterium]